MDTITFTPDWTSLPEHLLAFIAKRLHTRIDILRFRAVCRSFRSALPPPPKLIFPLSILTTTDFLRGPNPSQDDQCFLIESSVYAIEPLNKISGTHDETSQTWLIKVEDSEPGRVQFNDPISGHRFKDLSKSPKSLNLLDYRVREITKSYVLVSAATIKGHGKHSYGYGINTWQPSNFAKLIFSTCHNNETDDEFAVMTRYKRGRKLSVWRNLDKKWTDIDVEVKYLEYIEDIIYHNHKFYALSTEGLIIIVDSKSLTVTEVAAGPEEDLDDSLLYLVESFKDLFLIIEYEEYKNQKHYFKAFKLDEEKCKWVMVVERLELEDRVLFVGTGSSYSVSAKEFPGCKKNSVYFIDEQFQDIFYYPGDDAWIFDFTDGKAGKLSDFPGCSNLFWPPPSWLN